MNDFVRNMIDAIDAGDTDAANAAWNSAMGAKVSDAIEAKRIEIAGSVYNTIPVDDVTGEELETEIGDTGEE